MFWKKIAHFILANRPLLLLFIAAATAWMGFQAVRLELSYELAKILPQSDPSFQRYEQFKKTYGEDGNVMVIAVEDPRMYELDRFTAWSALAEDIKKIEGIKNVLANATMAEIVKDEEKKSFQFKPLAPTPPQSQAEVDSIKAKILRLPFYKGLLYSDEGDAHLMAITFDQKHLNSKGRVTSTREIEALAKAYGERQQVAMHYSGMPYIRTNFMSKVSGELALFMALAFGVTTLILYLFFRSVRIVFFAVLIVAIAVIWSVGLIQLFGYKITILTGLIPPLIIVIGIPNSIFLINRYQEEYLQSQDQRGALAVAIEKIGKSTFIANLTTFIGFIVFYFTGSNLLMEFGLVASLCVMTTWAISLILIPTIFSYLAPPSSKHVKHLSNNRISGLLEWIVIVVMGHRTKLYWTVAGLVVGSVLAMTQITAVGYVVDDLPEDDPIFADLKFIEKHFKGVIPFEVSIDTKTPNGVLDPRILNKIKVMQNQFAEYDEFTSPLSIVEGLKFIYQGYRGGDPKYYVLPGALELQKLNEYAGNAGESAQQLTSFMDSTRSQTRVSYQVGDIGSKRLGILADELQAKIDTLFNYDRAAEEWLPVDEQVDAKVTGNGVVFTKGNAYLLDNLVESTALAILLVCFVMGTQFLNARTILISAIPSIIPLIITAGVMGIAQIPLKPSTTLIFSIAFGIASDGTIYFLTKYKDEINMGRTLSEAVQNTIRQTGVSMVYTAIILFFGFGIFVASGFKGTVFLGLLVSMTLLIGMISNLMVLPAFLLTLDKRQQKRISKRG